MIGYRRYFIAAIVAFVLSAALWDGHGMAAGFGGFFGEAPQSERTLSFYNTHTRERLTVSYRGGIGREASDALNDIEYFLRDHRSGQSRDIDEGLLDLLHDMKADLERRHPGLDVEYHVISGYRSKSTNDRLRAVGGGQAKDSQHTHGKAIDIRVPGVNLKELRDIAWCLQRGGVGYYKGSDFVHVDTARVRSWHWKPAVGMCGRQEEKVPSVILASADIAPPKPARKPKV
ncbi:MAG: DUF882 domain-containing protein [Proteobacteria bacterium]|nr:DUF882 domain-containing protein [Pseudomonadota bacterium]